MQSDERRYGTGLERGATLIELAIAILILGFLTAAGFTFVHLYGEMKAARQTETAMQSVEDALGRYKALYGRYPCPAPLTAEPGRARYGKASDANCASGAPIAGETFRAAGRAGQTIRYGAVPFKDLNLAESATFDGNRRRIVYAVTEYYASGVPDFSVDRGAIAIIDGDDGNATAVAGNVIYAFYSPGKDRRGAYNYDGKLLDACDTAVPAGENCDFDGTLRADLYRRYDTGKSEFSSVMRYAASGIAYEWRSGAWSACSCSAPGVTRTVACYNIAAAVAVADSFCAAVEKPATAQDCTMFCWQMGPWSGCPCDATSESRSVTCHDNRSLPVGSNLCPPPAPASSRSCSYNPCPPPPPPPPPPPATPTPPTTTPDPPPTTTTPTTTTPACTPKTVEGACTGACGGTGTKTVTTTTCSSDGVATTATTNVSCTMGACDCVVKWIEETVGGCEGAPPCGGQGWQLRREVNSCTGEKRQLFPDAKCYTPVITTGSCCTPNWQVVSKQVIGMSVVTTERDGCGGERTSTKNIPCTGAAGIGLEGQCLCSSAATWTSVCNQYGPNPY